MNSESNDVIYQPIASSILRAYANEISSALATKLGPKFADPDVALGLATFLTIAATIRAKQRNVAQNDQVDSRLE